MARSPLYSTVVDLIGLLPDVAIERVNISQLDNIIVRSASQLEAYIKQADSVINMYLAEAYPTITSWTTTPWSTNPFIPVVPSTGATNNNGTGKLLSVNANSNANTSGWLIECTTPGDKATGKYSLYSFNNGGQGANLKLDANETSTNGEVTIPTENWVDDSIQQLGFTLGEGDQFLFSVINVYPAIWTISVTLAAAFTLNSLYIGQYREDNAAGAMYFNRATNWLEKIKKKELAITTGLSELNILKPTQIKYEIDDYGNNITPHATDEYNSYNK